VGKSIHNIPGRSLLRKTGQSGKSARPEKGEKAVKGEDEESKKGGKTWGGLRSRVHVGVFIRVSEIRGRS